MAIPVGAFNRDGTIFAYAVSYDWSKVAPPCRLHPAAEGRAPRNPLPTSPLCPLTHAPCRRSALSRTSLVATHTPLTHTP
eukprot:6066098-Prymnesium_polylepis.1